MTTTEMSVENLTTAPGYKVMETKDPARLTLDPSLRRSQTARSMMTTKVPAENLLAAPGSKALERPKDPAKHKKHQLPR